MTFKPLIAGLNGIEGFALSLLAHVCRKVRETNRVFFIGNGGSAAIASHMAADWLKNGGFAAQSFNDGAALTCISNDIDFDQVFLRQISVHAKKDDLLFAISSSGQSANICMAARWAVQSGLFVVTLSGFQESNPLRRIGRENIYVPSNRYGVVEIAHLAVLHAILDELTAC